MEKIVDGLRLTLVRSDITTQDVEGVVNAANTTMRGGGGVDGAIHAAGGPDILEQLRNVAPNGAAEGEVVVTRGFRLPARYVLHVAGPIWQDGHADEDARLRACYDNCLAEAARLDLKSLAFPSISTGAYGYPVHRAAPVALGEALRAAKRGTQLEEIRFVVHDDETEREYRFHFERFDDIHPAPVEFEDAGLPTS